MLAGVKGMVLHGYQRSDFVVEKGREKLVSPIEG